MKKFLINTGNGVVLSDAIAAILHNGDPEATEDNKATLVLRGGGHLPTTRQYPDLAAELEEIISLSPLTDFVPEIAAAMEQLRGRLTGIGPLTEPSPDADETGKELDAETDKDSDTETGGENDIGKGAHSRIAKPRRRN